MKKREFTVEGIDNLDRRILQALQKDGRLSNVKLASDVGLSPTPCAERVKKLESLGYIRRYSAILEPSKVGASLLVFVEIKLDRTSPDVFERFNKSVQSFEEIQECHLVSGSFDYLLKTRVKDMAAYRELLGETLLRLPAVSESKTIVVMEQVKESQYVVVQTG